MLSIQSDLLVYIFENDRLVFRINSCGIGYVYYREDRSFHEH